MIYNVTVSNFFNTMLRSAIEVDPPLTEKRRPRDHDRDTNICLTAAENRIAELEAQLARKN